MPADRKAPGDTRKRRRRRRWPLALFLLLIVAAAAMGSALGFFMRRELPQVKALEDYRPPVMTSVLDVDGALLDTFAEERRLLIAFDDIPETFLQALMATEDTNFYRHVGIDFKGIARAAWKDLRRLRLAQGASTLTQQLARNLFLHPDKTIRRKLQEALLALEVERHYTKEEILGFYCNQIYMGHGRYGLEAASRFYFGKPAHELGLVEAATLVGILQRPEGLSPLRHPERCRDRRNHVLRRMAEVGYLTEAQAAQAAEQPLQLPSRERRGDLAPYFVEEVRRWLQERFGSSGLYKEGLEVRTTLDPRLQAIANRAVDFGLRELDRRQGWRGPSAKVSGDPTPETVVLPGWEDPREAGTIHDGVITGFDGARARVRVAELTGLLDAAAIEWTGSEDPRKILEIGDVVSVRLGAAAGDGSVALTLEQRPAAQAALVAIEPATGAVRALVGGFDFEASEFNRAVQAKRQTGSAFKPFVYAAALSAGWTLADTVIDEPTVFMDPRKPEPYQPENYTNKYYGTITLRRALERSANIATVKLLDEVGYRPVIETAQALGIGSNLRPFASMALGAFETTLLELTSAYGALANLGVRVEPHFVDEVRNHDGAQVARIEPQIRDALQPQVAFLMNRLLTGVISDGTGRAARSLGGSLAGKTGTTDDCTDAWFIGYSPDLALGVWVGFDEPRTLGPKETGAKAALPIWRAFMEEALPLLAGSEFRVPPGIRFVPIDRRTGLRANPRAYCQEVSTEAFVEGTEPTESCSVYQHQKLRLPYPFHAFALDESGVLQIPAEALDGLLTSEINVRVVDGGRRLEFHGPEQTVSIPIEIVGSIASEPAVEPEPDPRLAEFDVETWVGGDGRAARIIWIDGRPRRRTVH